MKTTVRVFVRGSEEKGAGFEMINKAEMFDAKTINHMYKAKLRSKRLIVKKQRNRLLYLLSNITILREEYENELKQNHILNGYITEYELNNAQDEAERIIDMLLEMEDEDWLRENSII